MFLADNLLKREEIRKERRKERKWKKKQKNEKWILCFQIVSDFWKTSFYFLVTSFPSPSSDFFFLPISLSLSLVPSLIFFCLKIDVIRCIQSGWMILNGERKENKMRERREERKKRAKEKVDTTCSIRFSFSLLLPSSLPSFLTIIKYQESLMIFPASRTKLSQSLASQLGVSFEATLLFLSLFWYPKYTQNITRSETC